MSPKPLRREKGVIKGPGPGYLLCPALPEGAEGTRGGGREEAGLQEVLGQDTGPGAQRGRRGADTVICPCTCLLLGIFVDRGAFTSGSSPVAAGVWLLMCLAGRETRVV